MIDLPPVPFRLPPTAIHYLPSDSHFPLCNADPKKNKNSNLNKNVETLLPVASSPSYSWLPRLYRSFRSRSWSRRHGALCVPSPSSTPPSPSRPVFFLVCIQYFASSRFVLLIVCPVLATHSPTKSYTKSLCCRQYFCLFTLLRRTYYNSCYRHISLQSMDISNVGWYFLSQG